VDEWKECLCGLCCARLSGGEEGEEEEKVEGGDSESARYMHK